MVGTVDDMTTYGRNGQHVADDCIVDNRYSTHDVTGIIVSCQTGQASRNGPYMMKIEVNLEV